MLCRSTFAVLVSAMTVVFTPGSAWSEIPAWVNQTEQVASDKVDRLIHRLGHVRPAARQEAKRQLILLGDAARPQLETAAKSASNFEVRTLAAEILRQAAVRSSTFGEEELRAVRVAMAEARYDDLITLCRPCAKAGEDDPALWVYFGQALRMKGEYARAVDCYLHARELLHARLNAPEGSIYACPYNLLVLTDNIALIQRKFLNQSDRAIATCQMALALDPTLLDESDIPATWPKEWRVPRRQDEKLSDEEIKQRLLVRPYMNILRHLGLAMAAAGQDDEAARILTRQCRLRDQFPCGNFEDRTIRDWLRDYYASSGQAPPAELAKTETRTRRAHGRTSVTVALYDFGFRADGLTMTLNGKTFKDGDGISGLNTIAFHTGIEPGLQKLSVTTADSERYEYEFHVPESRSGTFAASRSCPFDYRNIDFEGSAPWSIVRLADGSYLMVDYGNDTAGLTFYAGKDLSSMDETWTFQWDTPFREDAPELLVDSGGRLWMFYSSSHHVLGSLHAIGRNDEENTKWLFDENGFWMNEVGYSPSQWVDRPFVTSSPDGGRTWAPPVGLPVTDDKRPIDTQLIEDVANERFLAVITDHLLAGPSPDQMRVVGCVRDLVPDKDCISQARLAIDRDTGEIHMICWDRTCSAAAYHLYWPKDNEWAAPQRLAREFATDLQFVAKGDTLVAIYKKQSDYQPVVSVLDLKKPRKLAVRPRCLTGPSPVTCILLDWWDEDNVTLWAYRNDLHPLLLQAPMSKIIAE